MKDTKKVATPNRRAHKRDREAITKRPISKPTGAGKGAYTCPNCHNTEHLPGAKFCMICGLAFPLKKEDAK